ncbi:hypothetical protein D3C85_1418750 [compost metagenome]
MGGLDGLYRDHMLPVVAEVVVVANAVPHFDQFAQLVFAVVQGLRLRLLRVRRHEVAQTYLELVQVIALPTHCRLDEVMQLAQRNIPADQHAPPHGRVDDQGSELDGQGDCKGSGGRHASILEWAGGGGRYGAPQRG